jgi:hypothetical protein
MKEYSEFDSYFHLWRLERHSPDFPLYDSADARRIIKERAASYGGLISISHFTRAFSELVASAEIPQLRQPRAPEPPEFTLTADEYNRLSAREITTRYQREPVFKQAVDDLISAGSI